MKQIFCNIAIVFILTFFLNAALFCQSYKIDSLYSELKKTEENLEKIDILHEIHTLQFSNEPEKSLETIEKAINLAKTSKNEEKLARLYQDKGISMVYLVEYDSALFYINLGLKIAEKHKNDYDIASCKNLLGTVYWYTNDFDKTIKYYKEALVYFKENNDTTRIYNCYSNLGTVYYSLGEYKNSTQYYELAFLLIDSVAFPTDAATCLNDMGVIYQEWGDRKKALNYFLRAIELNKKAENKRAIAANLNNIGTIFLEEDKYKKALGYYWEGYYADEEIGNQFGMAFSYISIGTVYEQQFMGDSALFFYQNAEQIFKQIDNIQGVAVVDMHRGNVYLNDKDFKKSLNFFQKSVDIAKEMNDLSTYSKSLFGLGASNAGLGNYEDAVIYLEEVVEIAKSNNFVFLLLDTYEYLANSYSELKNLENEIFYLREYSKVRDSIFSLEKEKIASELLVKYEIDKTEAELEILNKEKLINKTKLSRQRILIFSILLILFFAIITTFSIYKRYLQKKRTNELLAIHNEEIKSQQNEIESQNTQLAEQAKVLQELDDLKSRFFANISHEFRTPLSLIIGPIETIINENKDKNTQVQLKIVLRNAQKLLNLINQLLDLAKIDQGALKPKFTQGNISKEIGFNTELFSLYATENNLTLEFEFEEDVFGYYDNEKLEKILNNLISNAIKNTEKGKIKVSVCCQNEKEFVLKVSDTGSGIAQEDLKFIFDRFYMIENSTKKTLGSGIGLSFTKELVELLKGKIHVESELGKGTVFTVILPKTLKNFKSHEYELVEKLELKPKIEQRNIENYKKETKVDVLDNKSDEKVLVVEDHEELRDFISINLSKNYTVLSAENGKVGIEIAKKELPDLIITDVAMPKVDGIELAKTLKNYSETSHIPIIILTAKTSQESKLEGLKANADDYLSKPFNLEELKIRISNLLEIRKLLREKFMRSIEVNPSEVTSNSLDEQFLENLLKVIEENMSDTDFTVEKMCEIAGMSRSNVHKKLKSLVNQSATEFINSIRIKRAAQLLKQNAGYISEIAYEVGFNSLSYFNKIFKKHFDKTPTEMFK